MYLKVYDTDRGGSPRSLLGTSKASEPSPLVYDVVEDSSIYDIGSCSYIDDSMRHRLLVCLQLCFFLDPEGGSQKVAQVVVVVVSSLRVQKS